MDSIVGFNYIGTFTYKIPQNFHEVRYGDLDFQLPTKFLTNDFFSSKSQPIYALKLHFFPNKTDEIKGDLIPFRICFWRRFSVPVDSHNLHINIQNKTSINLPKCPNVVFVCQ